MGKGTHQCAILKALSLQERCTHTTLTATEIWSWCVSLLWFCTVDKYWCSPEMLVLICHTTQSYPIIFMFLSVVYICKQLTAPICGNLCFVPCLQDSALGTCSWKWGQEVVTGNIHYSNSYFVCLQIGRTQGQLRMSSHCRGYVRSPTKSGAFRDSAQQDLQISTVTYNMKCKPFFILSFHLQSLTHFLQ